MTPDAGCSDVFVGDPSKAPDLEPFEIGLEGSLDPIEDGDPLTLFTPPNGGKAVVVGALVANVSLENCGRLRIGAFLRDPTDLAGSVFRNAEASVRYHPMEGRPGWAEPILVNDGRSMGLTLEVCGFGAYPRDFDDCEWILDVRYEDERTEEVLATERRRIVPSCPDDDPGDPIGVEPELELALCQCACAGNHESGPCVPDEIDDWVDPPAACE